MTEPTSEELLARVLDFERRLEAIDVEKLRAEWFWTDKWQGSDAWLLPLESRGLYREMLTASWARGARLPDDHEAIRRATACSQAEWERCWPLVERYWKHAGTFLVNLKQLDIYAAALDGVETNRERARDAARKRWDRERERQDAEDARAHAQASARAVPGDMPGLCPLSLSPSTEQRTTSPHTPLLQPGSAKPRPERQRRQDSRRVADELSRYWDQIGTARGLRPATNQQRAEWRRALETGELTVLKLRGLISMRVYGLLRDAGKLAADCEWPFPGEGPFDVRGSPDLGHDNAGEGEGESITGGGG